MFFFFVCFLVVGMFSSNLKVCFFLDVDFFSLHTTSCGGNGVSLPRCSMFIPSHRVTWRNTSQVAEIHRTADIASYVDGLPLN